MSSDLDIGVVILAAGSSERLGEPKQLVNYQDKSLLQRIIDVTQMFQFSGQVLVLGAHSDRIRQRIDSKNTEVVINPDWSEGMASSIRIGLERLIRKGVTNVLFLLSDQPHVDKDLISKLVKTHRRNPAGITACDYGQDIGVPSIFSSRFFSELMELSGDKGAKGIMKQHLNKTKLIPFEKGKIDIDTKADIDKLRALETNQIT